MGLKRGRPALDFSSAIFYLSTISVLQLTKAKIVCLLLNPSVSTQDFMSLPALEKTKNFLKIELKLSTERLTD